MKYLGKASDVALEDVPDKFLKDSEVHCAHCIPKDEIACTG
jgi:hypothetical protein